MKRATKYRFLTLVFLQVAFLVGCISESQNQNNSGLDTSSGSDRLIQLVWQYISQQVGEYEEKNNRNINEAYIISLSVVDTYVSLTDKEIEIYALDYGLFSNREEGWVINNNRAGSTYLFIEGKTSIIDIKYSEDILDLGGFEVIKETALTQGNPMDLSKQSTPTQLYSEDELNTAFNAVKENCADQELFIINLWFDDKINQERLSDYCGTELYGMGDAVERGDLIVVLGDVISEDGAYLHKWEFTLIRDGRENNWAVVNQGYH